jgi:hypothetical protein
MIIDFEKMEEKANPEFKGGEGVAYMKKFENELGKIILGRLEKGSSIGLHTHTLPYVLSHLPYDRICCIYISYVINPFFNRKQFSGSLTSEALKSRCTTHYKYAVFLLISFL